MASCDSFGFLDMKEMEFKNNEEMVKLFYQIDHELKRKMDSRKRSKIDKNIDLSSFFFINIRNYITLIWMTLYFSKIESTICMRCHLYCLQCLNQAFLLMLQSNFFHVLVVIFIFLKNNSSILLLILFQPSRIELELIHLICKKCNHM